MTYLHPAKSPCLQGCDHRDMDKNCIKCQSCKLRLLYIANLDPENLCKSHFSNGGGKTRYVNRTQAQVDRNNQIESDIMFYAEEVCGINNLAIKAVLNTRNRKKANVIHRRFLIRKIKDEFDDNKRIAAALGIKYATILLALKE